MYCLLEATSFFPPLIYQVAFSSYKSNNFGSSGGKFDYVSFDILEISAAAAAIPVPIFKVHAHLRKFKPSTTRSCTKKNRNDLHHYYSLHDAFISGSLSKVVHKNTLLGNKSVSAKLHLILDQHQFKKMHFSIAVVLCPDVVVLPVASCPHLPRQALRLFPLIHNRF